MFNSYLGYGTTRGGFGHEMTRKDKSMGSAQYRKAMTDSLRMMFDRRQALCFSLVIKRRVPTPAP
jgi:hypothetical protein